MSNIIKKLRTEKGFTQKDLANQTGLSLRTIQRVESSNQSPKGHTLKVLASTFNILPVELQQAYILNDEEQTTPKDLSLEIINLSILSFFVLPFGNIIVPFILWSRKRTSKKIDKIGRKIINFQIISTLLFSLLLCISPFVQVALRTSIPLIWLVLATWIITILTITFKTAKAIERDSFDFLNLPVKLL